MFSHNSNASQRGNELAAAWTPTIYSDGGHLLYIGTSQTAMRNMINNSSQRTVAALDLVVRMEQVGGAGDNYEVTVRIGNGVAANSDPSDPAVDAGPDNGVDGVEYFFESATTDPEADELYYQWEFDDGSKVSAWYGPYPSGETCTVGHTYAEGDYNVQVRAKDSFGAETEWSTVHSVHIQCCVVRGNVDNDPGGAIDISDLVYLVDYMFTGGAPPPCPEAGNVDGSVGGEIDISDLVYLVDYMFTGAPRLYPINDTSFVAKCPDRFCNSGAVFFMAVGKAILSLFCRFSISNLIIILACRRTVRYLLQTRRE